MKLPWTILGTTPLISSSAREQACALRLAFGWRFRSLDIRTTIMIKGLLRVHPIQLTELCRNEFDVVRTVTRIIGSAIIKHCKLVED